MSIIKARKKSCEICGKISELRPYGPKGEWICFECGMKDEETTKQMFLGFLNSDDGGPTIIDTRIEEEN